MKSRHAAVALALLALALFAPAAGAQQSFRTEKDLLGEKQIPAEAYYGVQTARALENFQISGVHDQPLSRVRRGWASSSWRPRGRTPTSAR